MARGIYSDGKICVRACVVGSVEFLVAALIMYAVCTGTAWYAFDEPRSFLIGLACSLAGMFLILFWAAEYLLFTALLGAIGSVAFWSGVHHLLLWWFGSISSARYVWVGVTVGLVLTAVASWPTAKDLEYLKKRSWRSS